ncbi:hypothetical protein QQ045_002814 [Rhodiola kirilowii]
MDLLIYNGVTFEEIQGNMAVVKFDCSAKLEKVLDKGPWLYRNQAIVIKRWEMGHNPQDLDYSKIQFWVQIHNVQFELMNESITSGIAEKIGNICKRIPEET